MIEKAAKTKDMGLTVKEYHFAGSGKYRPLTIEAATRDEAEKIWVEKRQPAKVEENINNTQ